MRGGDEEEWWERGKGRQVKLEGIEREDDSYLQPPRLPFLLRKRRGSPKVTSEVRQEIQQEGPLAFSLHAAHQKGPIK